MSGRQHRIAQLADAPGFGRADRFLMLVKTYPIPSSSYDELVCCAGIDAASGEWIRMYPVNFRSLEEYAKFSKWQFIEATWGPPRNDSRPESRHVHQDTIVAGDRLPAGAGWRARRRWLDPIVDQSLEQLVEDQRQTGRSLGVIRPAKIHRLRIQPAKWDAQSTRDLQQLSFEWTGIRRPEGDLEMIPYDFIYEFSCADERCTTAHRMEIFDWEAGQAYRNFRRLYGEAGWEAAFRDKWERELPSRDLHLVLGTHHRWKSWMIVGVLYPPSREVGEGYRRSRRNGSRQEGTMTLPGFGLEAE